MTIMIQKEKTEKHKQITTEYMVIEVYCTIT